MANTGVKGTVTDEGGNGLRDLIIAAYDVDVLGEDRLGYGATLDTGAFEFHYRSQFLPDLRVRVFDPVGRLLFESEEHSNVSDPVFDIGRIIVPEGRGGRLEGHASDGISAQPVVPAGGSRRSLPQAV
jgi:hypothetical protein